MNPFTITVDAVADTGANVEAINSDTAKKYPQYIKPCKEDIRTASGSVIAYEY